MRPDYLTTAQAFDAIAPDYDAAYGPDSNAMMAWLRQESLALLQETFPPGSRLLEIGCGTGDEALYLAQAGYTILATDISTRMAARTHAKARAAGLADRVTTLALPGGCLDALRPPLPFDGAYASFGSLNCEPKLPRMADALAGLLRPGAAFVCSVMGRWCLFELAWFLLHGRPRTAFRRLPRGWQPASVTGSEGFQVSVLVRYLSVEEVARVFAPAFTVERVLALPLFLPPPYLENLFRRHRVLFGRLEVWERRLRERWPWRYLGDHVALVLRKP
ncbi:MAG: class I SAM-dependent methyltransferase [Dehalococcoidia bacterium]